MGRYPVSIQPYASTAAGEHYVDSYIRKWLNDDFLKGSFSVAEQDAIVETPVLTSVFRGDSAIEVTDYIPIGSPDGVSAKYPLSTKDKVYLPWCIGFFSRNVYWSSGNTANAAYRITDGSYLKDTLSVLRKSYVYSWTDLAPHDTIN